MPIRLTGQMKMHKNPAGNAGRVKKTKASSFAHISAFASILTNPMLSGVTFLF